MGLGGRVPRRVDAATKAHLLDLLDEAVAAGWPLRRACHELELGEGRPWRWLARREAGELADKPPGGNAAHGILADEAAEVRVTGWEVGILLRIPLDPPPDEPPANPPGTSPKPGPSSDRHLRSIGVHRRRLLPTHQALDYKAVIPLT